MLRTSENEFERRLLWRRAIKQPGITPTRIDPTTSGPRAPSRLPTTSPRPVETSLETRLEQTVPIKQQLDAARTWRGWRKPDFQRAYSAGKLLFLVVGVAGYAGYFISMHTLMRIFSATLMMGVWYAIYRTKGITGR